MLRDPSPPGLPLSFLQAASQTRARMTPRSSPPPLGLGARRAPWGPTGTGPRGGRMTASPEGARAERRDTHDSHGPGPAARPHGLPPARAPDRPRSAPRRRAGASPRKTPAPGGPLPAQAPPRGDPSPGKPPSLRRPAAPGRPPTRADPSQGRGPGRAQT